MSDDESEYPDYATTFCGPCTCDHEPDEHGWGSCNVEGCQCEAGWEE